jgi:hypothetical protein
MMRTGRKVETGAWTRDFSLSSSRRIGAGNSGRIIPADLSSIKAPGRKFPAGKAPAGKEKAGEKGPGGKRKGPDKSRGQGPFKVRTDFLVTLFGDDRAGDLVVGGLREDVFADEVGFHVVGAAGDDFAA